MAIDLRGARGLFGFTPYDETKYWDQSSGGAFHRSWEKWKDGQPGMWQPRLPGDKYPQHTGTTQRFTTMPGFGTAGRAAYPLEAGAGYEGRVFGSPNLSGQSSSGGARDREARRSKYFAKGWYEPMAKTVLHDPMKDVRRYGFKDVGDLTLPFDVSSLFNPTQGPGSPTTPMSHISSNAFADVAVPGRGSDVQGLMAADPSDIQFTTTGYGRDLDKITGEGGELDKLAEARVDLEEKKDLDIKKQEQNRQDIIAGREPSYGGEQTAIGSTGMAYSAPAEQKAEGQSVKHQTSLKDVSGEVKGIKKTYKTNVEKLDEEEEGLLQDQDDLSFALQEDLYDVVSAGTEKAADLSNWASSRLDQFKQYGKGLEGDLDKFPKGSKYHYKKNIGGGSTIVGKTKFQSDFKTPEEGWFTPSYQDIGQGALEQDIASAQEFSNWLGQSDWKDLIAPVSSMYGGPGIEGEGGDV